MTGHTLHRPGEPGYDAATSPRNASGEQRPALVARVTTSDGVAAAVRLAGERGLRLVPQGTGHGAGGDLGDDVLLLDTSGLTDLVVDPASKTATAGAGLTWGAVNAEAEPHGLLGLAGSSPSVGLAGYTFGGGVGWLCRPHGMASSALRAVTYVDGSGAVRRAHEDADDEVDRKALHAFRGGGGVGVATSLEIDLIAVRDLHAGHLLWPADRLEAVTAAWAATVAGAPRTVSTSLAVLHVPPDAPPFPEDLRGRPVVHLALADPDGRDGAASLLAAVRAAASPSVDSWGPADAARLGQIHLDPPAATSALGDGRWLAEHTPEAATEILGHAVAADSTLVMLELRSVGSEAPAREGAATRTAGPYVVHGVAPLTSPDARPAIDDAFAALRTTTAPYATGLRLGSWVEGATSVPDALPEEARARVSATADRVDPHGVLARSRFLT